MSMSHNHNGKQVNPLFIRKRKPNVVKPVEGENNVENNVVGEDVRGAGEVSRPVVKSEVPVVNREPVKGSVMNGEPVVRRPVNDDIVLDGTDGKSDGDEGFLISPDALGDFKRVDSTKLGSSGRDGFKRVPGRVSNTVPSAVDASERRNRIFLGGEPPRKPVVKAEDASVTDDTVQAGVDESSRVEPVRERSTVVSPRVNPLFRSPKPESEHKDQRPSVLKAKPGVVSTDWDDEETPDWEDLTAEVEVKSEIGTGFHLTDRDITIIRFLARYRYAYNFQIARRVNSSTKQISRRLKVLEKKGFLRNQAVSGALKLWLTTKAGNQVADVDSSVAKKNEWSWSQVGHTVGLVNVGTELEIGGENLLKEREWPTYNNFDLKGNRLIGENIVSEKEIRSAQLKWRMNRTTQEMNSIVEQAAQDPGEPEFDENGTAYYPNPPESIEGNEGLFVVYSPQGEHVPDMVVNRGRDGEGKPINIAIELELNEKTHAEWRKILRSFRDQGHMFNRIVYFTHKTNIANQLMRINREDVGMPPEKFMVRKYIPTQGREAFWG